LAGCQRIEQRNALFVERVEFGLIALQIAAHGIDVVKAGRTSISGERPERIALHRLDFAAAEDEDRPARPDGETIDSDLSENVLKVLVLGRALREVDLHHADQLFEMLQLGVFCCPAGRRLVGLALNPEDLGRNLVRGELRITHGDRRDEQCQRRRRRTQGNHPMAGHRTPSQMFQSHDKMRG